MVRSVFARLLDKIAPPLSIRHQFLLLAKQTPQTVRSNGPIVAAQHLLNAFQNYRRTGALLIAPPPRPYFYTDWIDDNELSPAQLKLQVSATNSLALHPLFSVIVPVYNPPLSVFRAALESVCDQTYNNWELCIANGGDDVDIRSYLDRLSAEDSRIKVCHLLQNGGISANSNQALALALGEFIVLLDHDDTLAPNLLYEVATIINQQSDVDVVYFDEDKLSADGAVRSAAWFKPQWSPDLMLSTNLLMHSVMRRTLVESVGRFDSTMDGAQDWDLAMRVSGCTTKITHIAKVLYHWRQITGSVASDPNAKPWAYPAQERCFQAHLARIGEAAAKLTFPQQGTPRIFFPTHYAKVSILIPTKDKVDLLRACISSILEKTTYHNYVIVVIDTGSREDSTRDYYRTLVNEQRVRILEFHGRFNWSSVNNFGAQQTTGEIILCLNNDTEVIDPQWLEEMVGWAMRPHIGVVGTRLLYADGKIQHQGIVLGLDGHGSHLFDGGREHEYGIFGSTEWGRNCLAVTGACLMVRRDLFEKLQGFDEIYEIGYSDIELCLRAMTWAIAIFVRPLHVFSIIREPRVGFISHLTMCYALPARFCNGYETGDPYFNPNLSYLFKLPSFAQPGELSPAQQLIDILEKNDCLPKGLPKLSC